VRRRKDDIQMNATANTNRNPGLRIITVEMSPRERMVDVIAGIDIGMNVIEIWTGIGIGIETGVMTTEMEVETVADVTLPRLMVS